MSAASPARRSSGSACSSGSRRRPRRRRRRRRASRLEYDALVLEREQQPLDAGAEPDARRRRAADLLDEPVVATAAADRRVGVLVRPDELEGGARVVVEPAHERRVEDVRHAERVEPRAHLGEVRAAGVAERVADLRRVVERGAQRGILDVEDLQRARRALVQRVLVEQVDVRVEPRVQALDVLRAGRRRRRSS